MKLIKLGLLLLLAGNAGTILSFTPPDSGKVCLTYPQFDFYAQKLIEHKGLVIDTTLLADQTRKQDKIIRNMDEQLTNSQAVIFQKDVIIDIKEKDYANLAVDYVAEQKKVKRWKQTSLVFGGISLVLLILVLLK